ncbi:MAG: hypothetical protein HC913_11085 [Microscillaceae bacterium]|nr:hypothetical protein [Microscillaceae bacterium]
MILRSLLSKQIPGGIYGFLCLLLMACGGGTDKPKEDADTSEATTEVQENLQKVLTDVPEPSELPYQLKATGAEFDTKLPNPHGNVEKYLASNHEAALNLGIYAADIGYVSVYEQVQNALDYVKAVERLGDKLDISNAFDPKMQERFKGNLNNIDSLTSIINEALKKSDQYLKDNERNNIAALIFAGVYIEGLYVATQLIDTYPDDLLPKDAKDEVLMGLARIITEQDKPLEGLLSALKSLEADDKMKALIADLEDLKQIFGKLNIQEKIEKNQGEFIINDETIKGITEKVKAIRLGMVG